MILCAQQIVSMLIFLSAVCTCSSPRGLRWLVRADQRRAFASSSPHLEHLFKHTILWILCRTSDRARMHYRGKRRIRISHVWLLEYATLNVVVPIEAFSVVDNFIWSLCMILPASPQRTISLTYTWKSGWRRHDIISALSSGKIIFSLSPRLAYCQAMCHWAERICLRRLNTELSVQVRIWFTRETRHTQGNDFSCRDGLPNAVSLDVPEKLTFSFSFFECT